MWDRTADGCCHLWELPWARAIASRRGRECTRHPCSRRETEIWAFIFAHTALKQNKFNFPLLHCIPAFIGMQWKKSNSSLMVKAEADSQKLHEEKKKRTAPCKNSQLLLELVHQPLLFFFPLQSEFMLTPTLKSVNHKSTQDPALLQSQAQSSARVTAFIILYLLCHFPETRLSYF